MFTATKYVSLALLVGVVVLSGCNGTPEIVDDRPIVTSDTWIDNPDQYRDVLASVGSSPIVGNESMSRTRAEANGTAALARVLKSEVGQLIENWAKEAGNMMIKETLSSYINDEVFTRVYVDTTISGARPVKYATRDGTQYVLMLLEPEKVASWYDQMSDALEQEALRDATLWKTEAMKSDARDRFEKIQKERKEDHVNKVKALMGMGGDK
jgi:hypothetical protein